MIYYASINTVRRTGSGTTRYIDWFWTLKNLTLLFLSSSFVFISQLPHLSPSHTRAGWARDHPGWPRIGITKFLAKIGVIRRQINLWYFGHECPTDELRLRRLSYGCPTVTLRICHELSRKPHGSWRLSYGSPRMKPAELRMSKNTPRITTVGHGSATVYHGDVTDTV